MLPLLTLLVACQEPFGSDRHTLDGARIAGLATAAPNADGTVDARALVVVDGALWAAEPLHYEWAWLDANTDPEDWDAAPDATDAAPTLPAAPKDARLLLVVTWPDDTERRAVLEPDSAPGSVGSITVEPGPAVEPDGQIAVAANEADGSLRWMGTRGTWFEQTPTEAEWTPADIVMDGEEVVSQQDGEPGVATLIALLPGADWSIVDVWVGAPPTDGALVDGRWIQGAIVGPQVATLEFHPTGSTGLRATNPQPIPVGPPPPGLAACQADFQPNSLAEGRCTHADLIGRQAVFEGVPWP